jgi:site-specific DNA-methyltransferase (adenine-specific)
MLPERYLGDRIALHCGDCREVLAGLPECSIDACVTDPPYGLGFMGRGWDHGVPGVEFWRHVYRVLKPGAHLLAMGGTRTFHRLACAIEDAGFEVRDTISWLYGSGFPKSHNVGNGWGTALKPACELIVLARKPLSEGTVVANVLRWGTGGLNIAACRVPTDEMIEATRNVALGSSSGGIYGAASVPGEYAQHVNGRWPANVVHDGSEEVTAAFPETTTGKPTIGEHPTTESIYGKFVERSTVGGGDSGSAARFFYTAKADADDRLGSKHPTVKPLDLMQWLVRLVTPKGGTVLDPFAGTGTTGEAAWREGMSAVLVEAEPEYQTDIRRRMDLALAGPDERVRESIKAKNLPRDDGPLFAARETYNATDDFARSIEEAYRVIRERKANGGPGWVPKGG